MNAKYSYITKYIIKAICEEPLHIGSASGNNSEVLVNPIDDRPFIQASSISGAFGNYIENSFGKEIKQSLFGSRDCGKSSLMFSDAEFDNVSIERRPRLKLDGKTGTVATSNNSGQKLELEYVSAGSSFTFEIHIIYDENKLKYEEYVEDALVAVNNCQIVFGGQKTNGCGTVSLYKVEKIHFNMTEENDRNAWIDDKYKAIEITEMLKNKNCHGFNNNYEIIFEASADKSVLVKSLAVMFDTSEEKAPDAMNITNNKKERVIPGSSFKGVIRNRVEAIADYKNIDIDYINKIFGRASEFDDNGIAGTVKFGETVIKNKKERVIPRIKIDKFTGGVAANALFSEMPVVGQIKTKISILQNKNISTKAVCGLIILALRDLAIGAISIGSGANIGRGFLNTSSIKVKQADKTVVDIDMKNYVVNCGEEFVKECLGSVKTLQRGQNQC